MIVVIGILAAITIVAYNGITQRAQVSSLSTDLEGAAKQLAIDQVTNSAYPATPAVANNGAGLQASPGTTYQYAVNNSASPQTFCITATNGTTSYYASSTSNVPTAGACAGQGVNGVAAITNLIPNPSFEGSGITPWALEAYTTATLVTGTGVDNGVKAVKLTKTASGLSQNAFFLGVPLTAGTTYTLSFTVMQATGSGDYTVGLRDANGSTYIVGTNTYSTPPSVKTRVTYSGAALTTGTGRLFVRTGTGAVGDSIIVDSFILTTGSTVYNYADGSSSNWIWNGTPNTSTSTGPPL